MFDLVSFPETKNLLKSMDLRDFTGLDLSIPARFPYYDIYKVSEGVYNIDLATAGFSKEDMKVRVVGKTLTIEGSKNIPKKDYIHRGIKLQGFTRSFTLNENSKVASTSYKDGILTIQLHMENKPEEKVFDIQIE